MILQATNDAHKKAAEENGHEMLQVDEAVEPSINVEEKPKNSQFIAARNKPMKSDHPHQSKEGHSFMIFLHSMLSNVMEYIFGRNDKR